MNDQSTNTERVHQRRRVIKGGTIAFNLRRLTYPCVVRDLSVAGARLQVDSPDEVPDTFDLLIELDGFETECEVVWREGKQIGVRFLAEPRTFAPKRKQVVTSSDHTPLASIRLAERGRRFRPSADRPEPPAGDIYRPMQEPGAEPQGTQTGPHRPVNPILIAEDDPQDRKLFEDGFARSVRSPPFDFVEDKEELAQYLAAEDRFSDKTRPGMVVLDFDAPRVDGLEALRLIKTDPDLKSIPVLVMTDSNADSDIDITYGFGVGSYLQKPRNIGDMVDMTRTLTRFWNNYSKDRDGGPQGSQGSR